MKPGTVVVGIIDPGQWSACFGLSLTNLYLRDQAGPHRIIRNGVGHLRSLCGTGGLPDARNDTVAKFLDLTDGEYLWFIDTDMGFAPDTVDRLIASSDNKRRVMGGLCFQLKRKRDVPEDPLGGERFVIAPTLLDFVQTETETGFRPRERWEFDEVVQVAGTGAACLLIHREALKKVRDKYGDHWFSTMPNPAGSTAFSEDLSFCIRLASVDIPVHVDTSVKTTHEKGGIFLDEEAYARDRTMARLEKTMTEAGDDAA
jgi:hypothetical protein